MKLFGTHSPLSWQKVIMLTGLVMAVLIVGIVVIALLYPNVTNDYEFVTVPTLTPALP